jgi:hypothetical protein
MAVFSLLASLCVVACRSRDAENAVWEGKREAVELSQRLELLTYMHDHGQHAEREDLTRLEEEARIAEPRLTGVMRKRSVLAAEIQELESRFAELRESLPATLRSVAIGRKYDSFPVADGRVFHQVSITGIDDLGVSIRHKEGAARVRFWDLTPEQRDGFGLDEVSAQAAACREDSERLAYEDRIERELAAAADKANAYAEVVSNRPNRDTGSRLPSSAVVTNDRPLSRPPTPFGRRTYSVYRYGFSRSRYCRSAYTRVYPFPTRIAIPTRIGSCVAHPPQGGITRVWKFNPKPCRPETFSGPR